MKFKIKGMKILIFDEGYCYYLKILVCEVVFLCGKKFIRIFFVYVILLIRDFYFVL